MSFVILFISIVTQFIAAAFAINLIRLTGFKLAWGFIAAALILMGVRRSTTFYGAVTGVESLPVDSVAEALALLISVLILAGVILMGRMFRDVSEKSLFLDSIVENIPNMVFVKEAKDLRFSLFNKAGEDLIGLSRKDLIGESDFDFFPKQQAEHFVSKDREALASRVITDIPEEPIETQARGQRLLHTRKISIRDDKGVPLFLLGISEDITEKKEVEAKLTEALIQAEAANEAKSEFLAVVSHELRTPLTSINGSLGLIAGGAVGSVSPEVGNLIGIAVKNGERLVSLVNDILDMEKIESGRMEYSLQTLNLNQLVSDSVQGNKSYADQFEITLNENLLPHDAIVSADGERLNQVLTNLISNAVKFSPRSSEVMVSVLQSDDSYRIEVTDRGPGIAPEFAEHIFEKFTQADASDTRNVNGTGLGLSISKAIIEGHGGQLLFDTAVDKGTTFYFDLPAASHR